MTAAEGVDPALDLVLERVVDAPAAWLFRGWTDPELLPRWFCPAPWRVVECTLDPRPGGAFHTVMQGPEGERVDGGAGCFLEVVPDRRVVWTDALGPGYRPRVEPFMTGVLTLEPQADGRTRYRALVRHQTPEARAQHAAMGFAQGWGAALDQLVAIGGVEDPGGRARQDRRAPAVPADSDAR